MKIKNDANMKTLHDLYKALGYNKPFKKDGTLSKQGEEAEIKLYDFLTGCAGLGLIDIDEDRIDEVIYEIMWHS